jgi:hypothetical protein
MDRTNRRDKCFVCKLTITCTFCKIYKPYGQKNRICIHISKKQTTKDNHVSTLTIVNCRLLKMSFPASYNGTFWLLICCTRQDA